MRFDERQRADLLVALYDSAIGKTSWTDFLAAFAKAFSATKAVLFSQVPGHNRASFGGAVGLDARSLQMYTDYYATRNVLMSHSPDLHVEGIVRTSESCCPQSVFTTSEYYVDYLRPLDVRHSIGITILRDTVDAIHLSAFRPSELGPFRGSELRHLRAIYLHLRQAAQLRIQLGVELVARSAFEQVVDALGKGVAVLGADGRVVYANRTLERQTADDDGLALTRSGLSAHLRCDNQALKSALMSVVRGGSGDTLAISRPSGKQSYALVVSPVLSRLDWPYRAAAAALVVVSDPAKGHQPSSALIQQRYGLTPTEARVALRVAGGMSLRQIAAALRISPHTARTHLKRILEKTQTHRQAELVSQLKAIG